MKQRIRILTDTGLRQFRTWLQAGGVGAPPVDALLDPTTSEILPDAGEVERQDFDSRYDLAVHVNAALAEYDFNRIGYAAGLWAWLSLFYMDLLCPVDRHGQRTVLEIPRYLLTPEYRNYYRHLIREAVLLVRRHGEYARALLTSRAGRFRISRVFEDIAARQDLISNPGIVELVWRLYFNAKRKTVRPGVAAEDRAGGIRRFALVLQQLSLNYDLPALDARQIADLLPREFEPWKRRANWEPVSPVEPPRGSAPRVRFDAIPVGSQWRRSQLTDLWGYGDENALRNPLIAPRGMNGLVCFLTGGAEPARDPSGVSTGGTIRCTQSLPQPTVRRLARAAKDETPVHVFQRPQSGTPFVYMGKARVGAPSPSSGGAPNVEFRLFETVPTP